MKLGRSCSKKFGLELDWKMTETSSWSRKYWTKRSILLPLFSLHGDFKGLLNKHKGKMSPWHFPFAFIALKLLIYCKTRKAQKITSALRAHSALSLFSVKLCLLLLCLSSLVILTPAVFASTDSLYVYMIYLSSFCDSYFWHFTLCIFHLQVCQTFCYLLFSSAFCTNNLVSITNRLIYLSSAWSAEYSFQRRANTINALKF